MSLLFDLPDLTATLSVEGLPVNLPSREEVERGADLNRYLIMTARFHLRITGDGIDKDDTIGQVRMACHGIIGKYPLEAYDILQSDCTYVPLFAKPEDAALRIKKAVKARTAISRIEQILRDENIRMDKGLTIFKSEIVIPVPLEIETKSRTSDLDYFTI